MIRYIHIGDQICEGNNDFAFFNTITDAFISFSGEQVFSNMDDFILYAKGTPYFDRCVLLIPYARSD